MDYITIFPPVDGQTEFCGNLIILSPGINFILIGIAALAELSLTYADLENFMLTLILMVKIVKMVRLSGKSQLYTFPMLKVMILTLMVQFLGKGQLYQFPREEPVTITFHTNE